MLAAAAGGSSQLGDVEALLPADPQQQEPRQRALPSALSLHANWIESSDEEKEEVALVSHQPLKSLAMAAAAGPVGSCAAASPDCSEYPRMSPAHLIAPSRTTSHSLEIRTSWPAAEKLVRSLSMASPRIAAVQAAPKADATCAEGTKGAPLGSLLRRLSQQLHRSSSSSAATAAPAEQALAQPAAAAASVDLGEGDELELLLMGVHSAASNCSLGTPAAAGAAAPFPHLSPAHLIAPAQLAFASRPSTGGATTLNAVGPAAAADGSGSPSPNASSGLAGGAERAAPLMGVLQWQLLSQQLEEQQQTDWQLKHQPEGQPSHQAPPAMLGDAAPAGDALALPPSSTTSGSYDPLVAASRYLGSVGRQAARSSSSPALSSPTRSASPCGSAWQLLVEEGHVQRSLTHPIFGLQPGRDDSAEGSGQPERRRGRGLLAGLAALVSSQRSEGSPAFGGKSWTVRDSHIQFDLAADARPCPTPQPAAAWEQQALRTSWAAPPGAVYASLCEQLQQLDMRRARRAVRAELKHERESATGSAAPRRRRSLLARLLPGCFMPQAVGVLPRKLRRALERQRVHLICLGRLPYNPDVPQHFELWQAVCSAYASLGASATALGDPFLPPWQALGFSAPNPAAELADTGLLALLHLLLLADRAPRLAGQLLESSTRGLPTAVAAVQATAWTLRLLRSGELAGEARQLRSTELATERFFLGASDCCLQELLGASEHVQKLPQERMVRAILALAEERACAEGPATTRRGQRAEG